MCGVFLNPIVPYCTCCGKNYSIKSGQFRHQGQLSIFAFGYFIISIERCICLKEYPVKDF